MCLLLETIRFENGQFQNLHLHQLRMDASLKALFKNSEKIDLEKALTKEIEFRQSGLSEEKPVPDKGLFKCRVIYNTQIKSMEWVPYGYPEIHSLKMVYSDEIEYYHKHEKRDVLNELYQKRGAADDILIIKKGFITDTSFCNILFYNGKNWITPSFPLLNGTQRRYLLEKEQIVPAEITTSDLENFSKARLVNAMIRFEDALDVDISNIF